MMSLQEPYQIFSVLTLTSEALVGLIGVAAGGLIAIITAYFTNRNSRENLKLQISHESEIRSSNLQRERLEELYLLVDKWLNEIFSNGMSLSLVMEDKIDYNGYLDMMLDHNKDKPSYDFCRIEMIIEAYAPALKPNYAKVINVREKINDAAFAFKTDYQSGRVNGAQHLKNFAPLQLILSKKGDVLKEQIASRLRELRASQSFSQNAPERPPISSTSINHKNRKTSPLSRAKKEKPSGNHASIGDQKMTNKVTEKQVFRCLFERFNRVFGTPHSL